jgi:Mrp family chromosome partitioning ATPase/capsular polysaccharide biosynthesis protein
MTNDRSRGDTGDDGALWPVLAALRKRWWLVVVLVAVAVAVAFLGLAQRTPKYEAQAQILVTPYQEGESSISGIRILRGTGDGARDLQTATALLTSPKTAAAVASSVGGGLTASAVDADVTLEPIGGSDIVAVNATSTDPRTAARIADAYAEAAIAARNAEIKEQARIAIKALDGQDDATLDALRQQLRVFRDQGDPAFTISQTAEVPTAASGPSKPVVVAAAILAGLVLAAIGALLLERGDRRVRDRAGLLARIPVPVLTGVPSPRGHKGIDMPPPVREAFRTLQIQLDLRRTDGCRRILVTSASSGDGKTTTVLNLAFALISAGHRVIVVDFDLREPDLGRQLGLEDAPGVVTTLTTGEPLTSIMRAAPRLPPLRVVQVSSGPGDIALLPTLTRRMESILQEAGAVADYVLIDTAPLGEVGDALPLVGHVDDVLVVGRPGSTDRRSLEVMAGLFERAGVTPAGWVVTGVESTTSRYHDEAEPSRRQRRRARRRS